MRYLFFCALTSALAPLAAGAQDAQQQQLTEQEQAGDDAYDEPSAEEIERELIALRTPLSGAPNQPVPTSAPATSAQPAPQLFAQYSPQPAPSYAPPGPGPNTYYLVPTTPTPVATPVQAPPAPPPQARACPDGATLETADLPPGYALAAGVLIRTPPQGAERIRYDALAEQLKQAEAQRDALPAPSRIRIGVPITGMLVGFGTAIAATAVAHNAFTTAKDIGHGHMSHHDDINNDGVVNGRDQQRFRNIGYGVTGAAVVGALTGIISTAALGKRLARRQTVKVERRTVAEKIEQLHRQLDYGVNAGPQQLQFQVGGQF